LLVDFEKVRPITFGELLVTEFPPDNFIIGEGLLGKTGIMMIGGPPKIRKSFIAQTIMLDLVTARNLFGTTRTVSGGGVRKAFPIAEPQRVLFLEQEIGKFNIKNRIVPSYESFTPHEQQLLRENLVIVSQDHTMKLDTTEGASRIGEIIKDVKPTVVVFDPLIEFHTSDENDAQEMNIVMNNLSMLRNMFGFATIITHHTKKPQGKHKADGPDGLRGSSVLFGKGDSYLMLGNINRNAGIIRVDFTIRNGENLTSVCLKHEGNNMFEFVKWLGRD
jgi:RecA-family ATPase